MLGKRMGIESGDGKREPGSFRWEKKVPLQGAKAKRIRGSPRNGGGKEEASVRC